MFENIEYAKFPRFVQYFTSSLSHMSVYRISIKFEFLLKTVSFLIVFIFRKETSEFKIKKQLDRKQFWQVKETTSPLMQAKKSPLVLFNSLETTVHFWHKLCDKKCRKWLFYLLFGKIIFKRKQVLFQDDNMFKFMFSMLKRSNEATLKSPL